MINVAIIDHDHRLKYTMKSMIITLADACTFRKLLEKGTAGLSPLVGRDREELIYDLKRGR